MPIIKFRAASYKLKTSQKWKPLGFTSKNPGYDETELLFKDPPLFDTEDEANQFVASICQSKGYQPY